MVKHYVNRVNWLRAAVLGANDGILSTTSLVIGIAAANTERSAIILAALAGLVSGACSMAAGEFVSVSSQSDVEKADLIREKGELTNDPDGELKELTGIYARQGLDPLLAREVAVELTKRDPLEAHAREELGINLMTKPRPMQAAMASAASFISGALLPLLVAIFAPLHSMLTFQYIFAIIFLAISGATAAHLGGSSIRKAIFRICFWGTVAMIITALVGFIFGNHIK
ncbi:MAG: VIT1/CCC1 transporter family protein [Bacteroidales bacterium]